MNVELVLPTVGGGDKAVNAELYRKSNITCNKRKFTSFQMNCKLFARKN